MKILIVVSLLVAAVAAGPVEEPKVRYDNHKVYRFVPKDEAELKTISSLEESFPEIMFWKGPSQVGRFVDVMMPPHLHEKVISSLKASTLQVPEPYIQNVQALIDEEEAASIKGQAKTLQFGWEAYYDYDDVMAFLDDQVARNPGVASVQSYGKSFEDRDLKVIKISSGGNGTKPIIWLDANIHAREWITNAVATYIINELINGESSGIRGLLDTYDFHVAPLINPDGYQFSRDNNRMWRKTRSNYAGVLCRGADPNRNFGFHWNTGGSSALCIMEDYHGVRAFSEPETQAIADYYTTIADRTAAYLSLHSYSQLILISYGTRVDGSNHIPDHNEHMRVGRLMETAIARRYGTRFEAGNIVDLLYTASGGSGDWAKGVHNTTYTFTFELRDTGNHGFLLPPDQIIPSSLEIIDGILEMAKELSKTLNL